MGKEIFEGAQRYVALQALDNLWMEHLDTMDHLRDSVRLRGYGQRDPLVEYKREGHGMFQRLLKEIDRQIVHLVFHLNVQVQPQAQQPTNLQMSSAAGASTTSLADPSTSNIGRNDPCPCGSGKKWKKCGMLNTPEHQTNMLKPAAIHEAKVGG